MSKKQKNHFVMINAKSGGHIFPLLDENDRIALFETDEKAATEARTNRIADVHGFEVFKRGDELAQAVELRDLLVLIHHDLKTGGRDIGGGLFDKICEILGKE